MQIMALVILDAVVRIMRCGSATATRHHLGDLHARERATTEINFGAEGINQLRPFAA